MPKTKKKAAYPEIINKEATIRKIRALMEEKNISEKDMARRIHVNIQTVRNWLSGKTFPNKVEHIFALSKLFDVLTNDFIVLHESGIERLTSE